MHRIACLACLALLALLVLPVLLVAADPPADAKDRDAPKTRPRDEPKLKQRVAELEKQIAELQKQVAKLRRQLPVEIEYTPTERDKAVEKKLQQPLPINFEANRLVNVLDYLRNTTGVSFFVNWGALEAAGIEQDMPVTMQLTNVPAETAIKLVLKQTGGAGDDRPVYGIVDGMVVITTASDFRSYDATKIRFKKSPIPKRKDKDKGEPSSKADPPADRNEHVDQLSMWEHQFADVRAQLKRLEQTRAVARAYQPTKLDKAVAEKLKQPLTKRLESHRLVNVVDHLRETTGLNIFVN